MAGPDTERTEHGWTGRGSAGRSRWLGHMGQCGAWKEMVLAARGRMETMVRSVAILKH